MQCHCCLIGLLWSWNWSCLISDEFCNIDCYFPVHYCESCFETICIVIIVNKCDPKHKIHKVWEPWHLWKHLKATPPTICRWQVWCVNARAAELLCCKDWEAFWQHIVTQWETWHSEQGTNTARAGRHLLVDWNTAGQASVKDAETLRRIISRLILPIIKMLNLDSIKQHTTDFLLLLQGSNRYLSVNKHYWSDLILF